MKNLTLTILLCCLVLAGKGQTKSDTATVLKHPATIYGSGPSMQPEQIKGTTFVRIDESNPGHIISSWEDPNYQGQINDLKRQLHHEQLLHQAAIKIVFIIAETPYLKLPKDQRFLKALSNYHTLNNQK